MPRIDPRKTGLSYSVDGAWCSGCGLYAHVNNGEHRADCTHPDPKPKVTVKR